AAARPPGLHRVPRPLPHPPPPRLRDAGRRRPAQPPAGAAALRPQPDPRARPALGVGARGVRRARRRAPRGARRPRAARLRSPLQRVRQGFTEFLDRYRTRLRHVFETRGDADRLNLQRGLPPYVLNQIREHDPLSAWVPEEYGGRGGELREALAVLEATGYESLPLTLLVGINGGLFLQPVAKYGQEAVKRPVFDAFLRGKRMGGLMITEPDYGSDALNMQTSYRETGRGTYH